MITVKCYNNFKTEHLKYNDILENEINITKSSLRPLELKLLKTNRGKHRRIRNNHELRLARFKNK